MPFHDIEDLRRIWRELTSTAERARAIRESGATKLGGRSSAERGVRVPSSGGWPPGRSWPRARRPSQSTSRAPRELRTTSAGFPDPRKESVMLTQRLEESPRDRRGGQVSHLLLGPRGSVDSERLAVTWVVGEPGSEQEPHLHEHSEQAYVIVRGRGLMRVGEEAEEVTEGVLILIPAGAAHSIRNVADEPLVYVSATTPPFEVPAGRWEG